MDTDTTTKAHDIADAITVAEFVRRIACGETLSEDEARRCSEAHRRFLLAGDGTHTATDDAGIPANTPTTEEHDDRVFAEVFATDARMSHHRNTTMIGGVIAMSAGVLASLALALVFS